MTDVLGAPNVLKNFMHFFVLAPKDFFLLNSGPQGKEEGADTCMVWLTSDRDTVEPTLEVKHYGTHVLLERGGSQPNSF